MNKAINDLKDERENSRDSYNRASAEIQDQLQVELFKVFDKCDELAKAVGELESSSDYEGDEFGGVYRYILYGVPSEYQDFSDELATWFSEAHCLTLDTGVSPGQHTVLKSYCGDDCIIINHEGDIFESHKLIISADDYRDDEGDKCETKRNQLIESYMKSSGYFPEVLEADYYGGLTYVNTNSEVPNETK